MPKRTLWVFLTLMVLLGTALVTSAQDTLPLESYLPANADLYASINTSDAYLDQLDGIIAHFVEGVQQTALGEMLPPEMMQQINIRYGLDMLLADLGTNFTEDIRPWLGDQMVVVIGDITPLTDDDPSNDDTANVWVLAQVTDEALASAFVSQQIESSATVDYVQEEGLPITAYLADDPTQPDIAIGNGVLMLGLVDSFAAVFNSRSSETPPTYLEAIAQLPAESYNITYYLNSNAIATAMQEDIGSFTGMFMLPAGTAQVMGYTLIDDALVMDMMVVAEAATATPIPAPSAEFIASLPADSEFVLYGAGLGALLAHQMHMYDIPGVTGQTLDELAAPYLDMVGLNLQDDIFATFDGGYALVGRYNAEPDAISLWTANAYYFDGIDVEIGLDGALVLEVTDAAKAEALYNTALSLVTMALPPELATTTETIADTEVTVITLTSEMDGFYNDALEAELFTPSRYVVELATALTDDMLVVGTKNVVADVLNGAGSVMDSAAYASAAPTLLPDPALVAFTDSESVRLVLDSLLIAGVTGRIFTDIIQSFDESTPTETPDERLERLRQEVEEERVRRQENLQQNIETQELTQALAVLIDSTSVSVAATEDGNMQVRLVLTLTD